VESTVAPALQLKHANWLELASVDADLQRVILAWEGLPEAIRRATLALVDSESC
jgi:hypothetical protein